LQTTACNCRTIMKYFSTRNEKRLIPSYYAIKEGLAEDKGLFVPAEIPKITLQEIREMCSMNYQQRAFTVMRRYLTEFQDEELQEIIANSYGRNFDVPSITPVSFIDDATGFLELWHGPTCAFKDIALQALPHLLTHSLQKSEEKRTVCILVATSGDTGKAALEGFADVKGTKIIVFYPRDGVSRTQKLQMITQKGQNVFVSSVIGNFDDAQTGVKKLFADAEFAKELDRRGYFLSSANSINWGRLLPQIVYYFSAYCDSVNAGTIAFGNKLTFAVPTGNFGDILAGWYAMHMGLPVRKLLCCSNQNNVLTDFIQTGIYDVNRKFYTTISPSMDILVSSNLERLLYHISGESAEVRRCMAELEKTGHYSVRPEILESISEDFDAGFASDEETKRSIRIVYERNHYLMDTHTATAWTILNRMRETGKYTEPAVVVSTASPFKFSESVLSALQPEVSRKYSTTEDLSRYTGIPVPKPLQNLEGSPVRFAGAVEKTELKDVVSRFLV
jgi:threonine synthase